MHKNKNYLFFNDSSIRDLIWLYKNISLRNKNRLLKLIVLMIFSAISEVVSISSIIPFLTLIVKPDSLENFSILEDFINFSGINNPIISAGLFLIIANIITPFLRLIYLKKSGFITAEIGSEISYKLYKVNMNQPYSEYINQDSSSLISAAATDIGRVVLILSGINTFITGLFISIFIFLNLLFVNWYISILSIIIFCSCYLFIGFFTKKRLYRNSKIVAENIKTQVSLIQEIFGSIREVLLYQIQDTYLDDYMKIDLSMRRLGAENTFLASFPKYILESSGIIFIILISFFFTLSNYKSENIIPLLGVFAISAQKLLPALQMIYIGWSNVKSYQSNLERVKFLINKKHNDFIDFDNINKLAFKKFIYFKNVSFKFKNEDEYILKDLNFKIYKGQKIGIVGTTGAGKSTLLNLLMGFLNPYEGDIFIDNNNIDNKENVRNLKKWQKLISYVPQDIYLKDGSFIENIAFGLNREKVDLKKIRNVSSKAYIREFIESTQNQFDTRVGERGVLLSGGQAQRIAIARALYRDSKLLIFDEATSSLDITTERKIINSIFSIKNDLTLIMIAHRLATLKYCDRIFSVSNKNIQEVSYEYLMKNNL